MSAGVQRPSALSLPRRPRRRPPIAIAVAGAFLGLIVLCAITGSLLAPHDPSAQDLAAGISGPSGAHLLGTDDSGRDIFSRVIAGSRTAIVGPLLVVIGAGILGTVFGLLAGYRGGWFDSAIMRTVDLAYALPGLLVAVVFLGVIGGGYLAAVGLLIVLTAPYDIRIVRGATLEQRSLPYVDAARTLGLKDRTIMLREIWPNVLPLIVANSFLNFAFSLVALAGLSFLGLGVAPGAADWGRMLSDNLTLIQDNPLAALVPGIALLLTATSMNLLGDWLFERISDRGRAR